MDATTEKIIQKIKDQLERERIRSGRRICEIVVHPDYLLPGWMFIVEKWNKLFLVIHTQDFERMTDGAPLDILPYFEPTIFDTPITFQKERAGLVTKGVYIWAEQTYPVKGNALENHVREILSSETGGNPQNGETPH